VQLQNYKFTHKKRSMNTPFRKSPVYCQGILVSKFLSLTPSLTDTEAKYPYKTYMQLIIFYAYRLQVFEHFRWRI